MEGNVVSAYLRRKFSTTLNDAEADLSHYPQTIMSRFRSIESLISSNDQNSGAMVDILYRLMNELSDFTHIFAPRAASNNRFIFLPREVLMLNYIARRLDDIKKNIEDTFDICYSTTAWPLGSSVYVPQSSHDVPDPSLITGFESQVDEIEKLMLMPGPFKPVGIVGTCGCGKTALAQKVFASRVVEKKFFPRIWLGLSRRLFDDESKETVLNHILREIGHDASDLEFGNYTVVQLLRKLSLRLTDKRYLIVLDDAWRMDEWFADLASCTAQPEAGSFAAGLPKGSGGAVIVTSRRESIIRGMVGGKHVIKPQLSDENICWTIFTNEVQQLEKIDPDHEMLNKMKDSIINNCQGLPLAAKTLANVISDRFC